MNYLLYYHPSVPCTITSHTDSYDGSGVIGYETAQGQLNALTPGTGIMVASKLTTIHTNTVAIHSHNVTIMLRYAIHASEEPYY